MMQRKTKPKRKGLGKYKPWTDEELDKMSEVTPQDIERAKAFLERAAPLMAKMLDATLDEDGNNPSILAID